MNSYVKKIGATEIINIVNRMLYAHNRHSKDIVVVVNGSVFVSQHVSLDELKINKNRVSIHLFRIQQINKKIR